MFETESLVRSQIEADTSERRRHGRSDVSPALLPLLRDSTGDGLSDGEAAPDQWMPSEPLAPARGIGVALALCTPIWCGIGTLLYVLIK